MIDTFAVLSPQNHLTISIGLKMYFLLTKNSARGAVRFSDRLGSRWSFADVAHKEIIGELARIDREVIALDDRNM